MAILLEEFMRDQLLDRRQKLEHAVRHSDGSGRLQTLLNEVDSALNRIEDGSFGICESCHETIECDRLIIDPLVRFCLDHLSRKEKSALERDLELAAQVQRGLLPGRNLDCDGWRICYHYEPAGLVSGDYCDVIDAGEAGLYFMVGDVSGKGVAASILMAHLHALFRALIPVQLSLKCMLERASRVFSESTLPNQYATLVCGRALPNGDVEICNAGHPNPLMVRDREVWELKAGNLPIGMFGSEEFSVQELCFEPGQSMVIYSDGVSEALDESGVEYGLDRLRDLVGRHPAGHPSALVDACRDDLSMFRQSAPKTDDVTLFVLGRGAV
jgi:sigma-B regulation protein RsbU (phosphoserine phosphatase)